MYRMYTDYDNQWTKEEKCVVDHLPPHPVRSITSKTAVCQTGGRAFHCDALFIWALQCVTSFSLLYCCTVVQIWYHRIALLQYSIGQYFALTRVVHCVATHGDTSTHAMDTCKVVLKLSRYDIPGSRYHVPEVPILVL